MDIANWGTVSKPISRWSQKHINNMYAKTLESKSPWKRASGLPIGIAHAALNIIEIGGFAAEPFVTAGKGLNNMRKFHVIKGIGQLIASVGQAAVVLIGGAYLACICVIRAIALTILMAINPNWTCKRALDPKAMSCTDFFKTPLASMESILETNLG